MGVYSKKPFGEPKAVLAYLGRYTHRVAISRRVADHAHAGEQLLEPVEFLLPQRTPPRLCDQLRGG